MKKTTKTFMKAPPNGQLMQLAPAPEPVEVPMDPHDVVLVQLASERLQNAQLHMQNRQGELTALVAQLRPKYEDGGHTVQTIDIARGVLTRMPR